MRFGVWHSDDASKPSEVQDNSSGEVIVLAPQVPAAALAAALNAEGLSQAMGCIAVSDDLRHTLDLSAAHFQWCVDVQVFGDGWVPVDRISARC